MLHTFPHFFFHQNDLLLAEREGEGEKAPLFFIETGMCLHPTPGKSWANKVLKTTRYEETTNA